MKRSRSTWTMFVLASAAAVVAAAFIAGCDSSATQSRSSDSLPSPYRVVTTCGMVTDIVQQIVGPQGEVIGLLGEGVDPHLYKPTSNDVRQLAKADIVFYSGLMLEGRMQAVLEQVAGRGRPVFAVTDGIEHEKLIRPAEVSGHYDPHVWMDVSLWRECTRYVMEKLSELDPLHAAEYRARYEAYDKELAELDEYIRERIATIPEEQRVLVTAHDAFEYFSRAYNIPVRSAQGISTESEPGVNDINELVDFLVEHKIQAIFVESSVSESNLKAVIEGAASKGWRVTIGGTLFSDAMGTRGTYEGTYIGMLDHNATVITRALGGTAPENGWRGKLSTGP